MDAHTIFVVPGDSGTYPSPTYPAAKVGETVYFSGIVGMDGDRKLVGVGDVRAQAEKALTTVAGALAALGGSLADIVHLTIFLTNSADQDMVADVLNVRFGQPWPPTTMVTVAELARPEFLIEIEPTAVIREPPGAC